MIVFAQFMCYMWSEKHDLTFYLPIVFFFFFFILFKKNYNAYRENQ